LLPKKDPFREGIDDDEGFIHEASKEKAVDTHTLQNLAAATGRVPLAQLGLSEKEIYTLCARFAPIAAKHCYLPKVEEQFLEKCRGYNQDCAQFQAQARPLGAVANAFSSGVGLTYYNWDVNGIPYYAVNEEGSIGNGHNGKVDFGSWGGGYSSNLGVRDYYSQTQEYGANWYEGLYGYKTGWSIPVVQSAGVEGGGGTQVHVPLKEGELGRPIQATSGYHVGPYFGYADRVGVDWYNGGVSFNRGVASPFVGIGVNSGTAVGFPSIGTIMSRVGIKDMDQLAQMVAAAGARTQQTTAIGG
uniref:SCP domain-containing protein n=1 Tax=Haemonchus placei TaxID=6290 RepID=A0A0N4X3Y5_HAEPC